MHSRYAFLADSYATEIEKVLSVWSMADDDDLLCRPCDGDRRGRNLLEHMVHQCVSEAGWFGSMFGIHAPGEALPARETRIAFLQHYAQAAQFRLRELRAMDDAWWETVVPFFELQRPRTWILVRRIAHTAHHRGQQTMLLRQRGRPLYSTYGPLLREEGATRSKNALPDPVARPVTERGN